MPSEPVTPPAPAVTDTRIFPELIIRPKVFAWRRLIDAGKQDASMDLLDDIIKDCTEMFKRLAQHEKFHYTVPLDVLVVAAQEKVPVWLQKWDPAKGPLFTWMSRCAKNVFRSEVVKVLGYTKRIHTTDNDTMLERLAGTVDHTSDQNSNADAIYNALKDLTCPWSCAKMRGAIRYYIDAITDDKEDHDKKACIRGASFAWGISHDMAKFLYDWTKGAMRSALHDYTVFSVSEETLIKAVYQHTNLGPMLDLMGITIFNKFTNIYGGQRIRIPTRGELDQIHKNLSMVKEITSSDKDPVSVAKIGRKFGKTERAAVEIFDEMTTQLDPGKFGRFLVYEDPHNPAQQSHEDHTRTTHDSDNSDSD